jgi:DNA-binding response OmpR family regulator
MKILVIDDDKPLREEVGKILIRAGHDADCVGSAKEAVPMAESGKYDFLLVDYRMPEYDGVWFMRNVNLPKKTKALLVTSYLDRALIEKMIRAGAVGYVIKPFDEEEILRHLEFHSQPKHEGKHLKGTHE